MVGTTVNEIIPEPSLTMVLGKYRQAIAENTIVRWEEISDYPTGRLTGVVSIAPVFDDKGTCTHLVGSVQDVTERKQDGGGAVRESKERFRLLSEAAFEAIAIHEEGVLLNANDQYFKMFGYEPGEVLGKEMMSVTIAPEAIEFVKKQIATDSLGPYESIGLRKDGTRFPMEIRARKMEYKGRNVRFGAILDITERKRAEEELKESEKKYRVILENASDAILLTDEKGNLIEANRMAEEFFGYSKEELLQMSYTQLHPMIELDRTIAAFKSIVTHGCGFLQNGVILRKDSKVVPVDITATAIKYNDRKVIQASFRDISEHKYTERTLDKLVRERTVELSEKKQATGRGDQAT